MFFFFSAAWYFLSLSYNAKEIHQLSYFIRCNNNGTILIPPEDNG